MRSEPTLGWRTSKSFGSPGRLQPRPSLVAAGAHGPPRARSGAASWADTASPEDIHLPPPSSPTPTCPHLTCQLTSQLFRVEDAAPARGSEVDEGAGRAGGTLLTPGPGALPVMRTGPANRGSLPSPPFPR